MTGVLHQLEALCTARRILLKTSRAFILTMDVLGGDEPLAYELQSGSASIAACAFAHDQLSPASTVFRLACLRSCLIFK